MSESDAILERIRGAHPVTVDLTLRPSYLDLLAELGNPQDELPNVIHVAGTNGKGSVCAFLRAMIEAAGKTANVHTSPHLLRFHERIRIKGHLIEEDELVSLLREIEAATKNGTVTYFEAGAALAFVAFARHKADVSILEVGLGGRLDATNVVSRVCADVITRLSFDHRDYLGDTMESIAREKAGILRARTPCYTAPQPSHEAMLALRREATRLDAPLFVGGEDWRIEAVDESSFRFLGPTRKIEKLPRPALLGTHQLWNAGLAIATSVELPFEIPDEAVRVAMKSVEWPARLQQLTQGALAALLPKEWELWIDGGHNDSAGEVLAAHMGKWAKKDGKPIFLVFGMLSSKRPEEFLDPMKAFISRVRTLYVEGEIKGFSAQDLTRKARSLGLAEVEAAKTLRGALEGLTQLSASPARILVCGSLYLAARVLRENGAC